MSAATVASCWAALAAALVASSSAAAQTESPRAGPPSVALSLALGGAVALVPMAIGGALAARSSEGLPQRRSLELVAGGLALAPVVSHLVLGEWSRAAAFGSVTLPTAILATALLENVDVILDKTKHPASFVLGGSLAVLLVTSGGGLADSLRRGERQGRQPALQLHPAVGKGTLAFSLRGRL